MPNAHPRPYHRGSIFGEGPRVPMCRERRAVWRARLHLFRRAKRITPLFEDIGLAMLRRLGTNGRLDPSHATLADDVGCDPRSVQRAVQAFRDCGLVWWVRRIVRDGWRACQTSNGYMLRVGELPANPRVACNRQIVGETRKIKDSPVQPLAMMVTERERIAAQAALAQRRGVIEARLLTRA